MKLINLLVAIVLLVGLSACSYDEPTLGEAKVDNLDEQDVITIEKDSAIAQFAQILSDVIYERQDVRKFLKEQASLRFDSNTDILYGEIKDKSINGETFRNILIAYSSLNKISTIEKSVPALNIFVPEIALFDITVDNMDCSDAEIPVVVSSENGMNLYFDGHFEMTVPNGELPDYHTFVVNENKIVTVKVNSVGMYLGYEFEPEESLVSSRSVECMPYDVGTKAIGAFHYFNQDNGSNHSSALQRDYIYYGITPENGNGSLNLGVTEYLAYLEVDPKVYYDISDQKSGSDTPDPYIKNDYASQKKRDFTAEELIKLMWSEGTYCFRFDVIMSNQSMPVTIKINLRPEDLWNFNYNRTYRHSTAFRSSRYSYSIDPAKFTSKIVNLSSKNISLGKWDLSKEGLERYIRVSEEDQKTTITETYSFEVTTMTSAKVNGSVKFGLGTGNSGEFGTDASTSVTQKESKSVTITRSQEDDEFGIVKVYFYDPIILGKVGERYILKSYSTGAVSFGITAK